MLGHLLSSPRGQQMGANILIVGEAGNLATQLQSLFEAEGYAVRYLNGAPGAEAADPAYDLCIACWGSREECPVEFLRDYQAKCPRGALLCIPVHADPWERSFLVGHGVRPDAVLTETVSREKVLFETSRLLASEHAGPFEYMVVFVDDDDDFLASLEQAVPDRLSAALPFETSFEFLHRAEDAVRLLTEAGEGEESVAMVVSDQRMPDKNGLELLGYAKRVAPFAVRVLLTGHAGADSLVDAMNDGTLDYYIGKPVEDLDQFTRTLMHLLKEYQLSARQRLESWQTQEQCDFLKELTRQETLEGTLRAVVDFVSRMLNAGRVSLMLCDEGQLTIRSSVGLAEELVASTCVPVGEGVAGRVFETGIPVYVTDASQFRIETPVETPSAVFASIPLLLAPMTVAASPLGIINVTDRQDDKPLTRSDVTFLAHTADAAAIAISNHLECRKKEEAQFDTVRSLALAVEAKDRYTRGHSERVALLAARIGERMELEPDDLEDLERAAIMHDVGKIGVPEEIIRKPGKLSESEFAHIRRHPVVGERIVSRLGFMARCLPIIRWHHERPDGRGYPDGLRGEDIPLGARIVAVADAYDAMRSERPYRKSMSRAETLEEIRLFAGVQFDPRCVEALVEALEGVEIL